MGPFYKSYEGALRDIPGYSGRIRKLEFNYGQPTADIENRVAPLQAVTIWPEMDSPHVTLFGPPVEGSTSDERGIREPYIWPQPLRPAAKISFDKINGFFLETDEKRRLMLVLSCVEDGQDFSIKIGFWAGDERVVQEWAKKTNDLMGKTLPVNPEPKPAPKPETKTSIFKKVKDFFKIQNG